MNILIIIENVFFVNRNYCVLTKTQRLFVGLRLLFEIALIAVPLVELHSKAIIDVPKIEFLFFTLNVVTAFPIICLALYHTKNFQNLKFRIEKGHLYFSKDTVYSRNLNRKFKFTAFVLCVYVILMVGLLVVFDILTNSETIVSHLYHVIMMFYNFRYIFEFVVLYCVLLLLSEQVKCITRRISNERKLILNEDDEDTIVSDEILQEITGFDEWTKVYTNIKECSNLINIIFGVQVRLVL